MRNDMNAGFQAINRRITTAENRFARRLTRLQTNVNEI